MNEPIRLKFSEFQQALTQSAVIALKVIQGALGAGIIFFGVVIFVLSQQTGTWSELPDPSILSLLQILTVAHIVLGLIMALAAPIIFKAIVNERKVETFGTRYTGNSIGSDLSVGEKCLAVIKTGMIVRLAMFESVAFFGLIICFLAVLWGVVGSHPVYLINAGSSLLFIIYIFQTFPTKQRIEGIFKKQFAFEY